MSRKLYFYVRGISFILFNAMIMLTLEKKSVAALSFDWPLDES